MTTSIVHYQNDFGQFYIDKTTGETFLSISSCAELVQVQPFVITRITRGHKFGEKISEVQTVGGLQGVTLLTEKEYVAVFAELSKKNKLANQLLQSLACVGARTLIHQQAGYQVQSTATGKVQALLTADEQLSLVDYAALIGDRASRGFLKVLGGKLSREAKKRGITLSSVPCPKWGKKNHYPATLIQEFYADTMTAYQTKWAL